jgi:hypothetical protein
MIPVENIHPAALPLKSLLAQCEVRRLRRSGPGGQHRNKVETAIFIQHLPTGVKAEANERRSQAENRSVAGFRLRVNLALEVRCPIKEQVSPSLLWQSRLNQGQIHISELHSDYPALLAEALDVVAAHDADVKIAAELLRISTSQLIKFLKQEPRAFQLVNRWREENNLRRLQ